MQLIKELNEDITPQILQEGKGGEKKYYIETIWMQGNIENRNGREYPFSVLESAANKYITEKVEQNRAFGELGHPNGPAINLDRVSHLITSLKAEGSNYVGRAKIMDTPHGKIVKNLMDEGAKFGVSSRGLGSVKKNKKGIDEVQKDFYIATAGDIVADPSAPDAFVNGIMESAEWVWDNGLLVQSDLEEARNNVNKAFKSKNTAKREEAIIEAFSSLMLKI